MRRGFRDLIAQQFSTIFSAGGYFSDYAKQSRFGDSNYNNETAPLCSGISFHLFSLTYSQAFAIP